MSNKIYIGIDLGTTNSCVAVMEGGRPAVKENADGARTTPSVVTIDDSGVVVGKAAKNQATTKPKNTVLSVKRFMGQKFADVKKYLEIAPYHVVDNGGNAGIEIDGKTYSPVELSAKILRKLIDDVEEKIGKKVTDAVITVPAYFNDAQRQATKDAGKIAGVNVERLVNEPTAAALAYGLDKKNKGTIAVYDLGGGTFDISILEISDGVIEVKSTNGDTLLGGEDFDDVLIRHVADQFKMENSIDLLKDLLAKQRLKEACENAKKELSSKNETTINIPFITADASGPKHLNVSITRAKFESLVADLVQSTLEPCKIALSDAGLKAGDIDEVVMVGGMTRMPQVIEKVKEFFGKDPHRDVNPDEVVALGAAVQGGVLQGDVQDVLLLDVTPLSLGIETQGGVFTRMIEKNTSIPTQKAQVFSTAADNQTSVTIRVFQGEREMATDNRLLGQFDLVGIRAAPRGAPQIEVTFEMDANGILSVSAKDKDTGKEQKIDIKESGGLSDEEIEKAVQDAQAHAEEDKKKKLFVEKKNQADAVVFATEKSLKDHGEKLDAGEKEKIEEVLVQLKKAIEDQDEASIDKGIADLNSAAAKLATIAHEAAKEEKEKGSEAQADSSSDAGEEVEVDAKDE